MGDSEDEFDRQRREKFQRERGDQFERRARERDWNSRERPRGWNGSPGGEMKPGGGMRPIGGGEMHRRREGYPPPAHEMKRRFSPGREPEMRGRKRMRPFEPGFEGGWGGPWDHPGGRPPYREEWGQGDRGPGGPPMEMEHGPRMMTFKQWLNTQSDDITDEDAVTKYTGYKVEFKRQQLQDFFIAHKDEEWFKEKYHPDEAAKRFIDEQTCVKWRSEVFKLLVEYNVFNDVGLDLLNELKIVKVLDSSVILMEGGKKFDLTVLDQDPNSLEFSEEPSAVEKQPVQQKPESENQIPDPISEGGLKPVLTEEQYELKKQAELYKQLVDQKPKEQSIEGESAESENVKKKKRDRGFMGYDDEREEGSSSDGNEDEPTSAPGLDAVKKPESEPENSKAEMENVETEKKPTEEGEVLATPKPRPLHQTHSIFMRNLPPTINKLEIINLCKKFPGFIRVAFSHPLEDRSRFFRRCWVTFDRSVNIKDICWNLNNLRLRDLELNPVVNRDLARRVRPISGIAQHHSCARNDLKNIARLIMHLDEKWKVWEVKSEGENKDAESGGGTNPWLKNISEYLVDESSAEEEDLLGGKEGAKNEEKTAGVVQITRDDDLIKVLDRLLYYLRIVHSVDYYNASEYPNEDEMPNRCGIMHARGPIPPNMLTQSDINEFQKRFNDKLVHILNFKDRLTTEEAQKLGPKDENVEVEKFIKVNSQELGKDKWLCPLSGKKFKGPDYIRKHIFNKHGDKVEGVKKDVVYFNNYLMDPRRPGPLEGAGARPQGGPPPQGPPPPGFGPPPGRGFGPPGTPHFRGESARPPYSTPQFHHRAPNPYGNGAGRTYPPKNREMRQGDPFSSRPIIGYQDLDAPDDTDFF